LLIAFVSDHNCDFPLVRERLATRIDLECKFIFGLGHLQIFNLFFAGQVVRRVELNPEVSEVLETGDLAYKLTFYQLPLYLKQIGLFFIVFIALLNWGEEQFVSFFEIYSLLFSHLLLPALVDSVQIFLGLTLNDPHVGFLRDWLNQILGDLHSRIPQFETAFV
jgi:hypothetical protein